MKAHWKRMLVWSSLGGVVIGAAVAIARKARKVPPSPLEMQPIPPGCNRISIWTEHFQAEGDGSSAPIQDRYLIQGTPFKVWSVFEMQGNPAQARPAGWRIFHVTHLRFYDAMSAETAPEEGQLQDRFYGTITSVQAEGDRPVRDEIGRGAILAIRKCSVGGASNGVETGEIHYSAAPILNFRFEYAAVEKRV